MREAQKLVKATYKIFLQGSSELTRRKFIKMLVDRECSLTDDKALKVVSFGMSYQCCVILQPTIIRSQQQVGQLHLPQLHDSEYKHFKGNGFGYLQTHQSLLLNF